MSALTWWATGAFVAPPIEMVVNNSYVLVAPRRPVPGSSRSSPSRTSSGTSARSRDPALLRMDHRRSMRMYLWHTLVMVLTYHLVGLPTSSGQYLIFASLFAVLLASIVPRPPARVARVAAPGPSSLRSVAPIALAIRRGWRS